MRPKWNLYDRRPVNWPLLLAVLFAALLILAVGVLLAQTPGRRYWPVSVDSLAPQRPIARFRHDGRWLLPDILTTPGALDSADTSVVCHRAVRRHVTAAMHHAVFAAYGIPWAARAQYEDDHVIALELGGRNDNANRFPQPLAQAHAKDSVENWARRAVCRGRRSLRGVQRQMARDWVVLYRAMHREPVP